MANFPFSGNAPAARLARPGAARHVLLVSFEYPPFPGGIATYAAGVVQALRDEGVSVRVLAPSYPEHGALQRPHPNELRVLRHHHLAPEAAWHVAREAARAPAGTVILAADIRSLLLLHLTRAWHRRPFRVMVHGSEASKFAEGSWAARYAARAYARAELVAWNSLATRDIFCAAFGTPRHGVVSYLGVNPRWFEPVREGFSHPLLAALPSHLPLVSTVGRIEPRKGHLQCVQALAQARAQGGKMRDVVYVIAGHAEDPAYLKAVEEEAAERGVRVVVTGRLDDDDVRLLYQRSACHVLLAQPLPGKVEGFGLVLVEAAAQGCPSVATAVGGIPEVLGHTGALVPEGDLAAAAQAIAGLVMPRLAEQRHQAGVLARARAGEFTWAACARATFPEFGLPLRAASERHAA